MDINIDFLNAQTHTPEYLMHKYWARKPHNVLNECIAKLTNDGDIIIDPFCGSGVALREGSLLNRKCYGFDLNPIAVLISKVLTCPPPVELFIKTFNNIYETIQNKYGYLYKTENNEVIKYVSHRILVECSCGKKLSPSNCETKNKKYICNQCGNILRFNLENMIETEVFDINLEKNKNFIPDKKECLKQEFLSKHHGERSSTAYNYLFPENKRILAFNGISTSSFFTNRNYLILTEFCDEIWKINNETLKNCLLLLLTASVAQCSRLIAHRNNLKSGGPAWSIPGFWVPCEHLETNPFVHLKARFNKFCKALSALEQKPAKSKVNIYQGNSLNLLNSSEFINLKGDLIFLDPPYGDSVPYTEFSNIWNSFLKAIPEVDEDLSVSDRIGKKESWNIYRKKLYEYMKCFTKHLNKNGKLLITFNNNDMNAWEALIAALQKNNFVCKSVFYQIPAVISSKSQKSIDSSYVSDVYSVYVLDKSEKVSRDLSCVVSHLQKVANSRMGILPKTVLDREFIMAWLKNNIDNNLLCKKNELIDILFDYNKKDKLYCLKSEYINKPERNIFDEVRENVNEILKNGPIALYECYKIVSLKCKDLGIMEYFEFKNIIKDYIIKGSTLYAKN